MPQRVLNSNNSLLLKMQFVGLIRCMRIKQWSKNLLVFAALIFSIGQASINQIYISCYAFILFCLVSSSVYLFNDFIDRENDKVHPQKCTRPIACGMLNPYVGLSSCFILLFASIVSGFMLDKIFGYILLFYLLNNIFYSLKLKHIVLLDIMSIALGFVLRAVAGGVVIKVYLTPWFLLCTLLIALFLAIGKRRHELILLSSKEDHRKVLRKYSIGLLDSLSSIVTTATIMCYSLYTFTSGKPLELMITIPLVIYGIFRYLYLIHVENKGGTPEALLIGDKPILATVIIYVVVVICILRNYS